MIEETGEHIVAGAGELHLEICLKDLQDDFMGGAEIKVSQSVCVQQQWRLPLERKLPEACIRAYGDDHC